MQKSEKTIEWEVVNDVTDEFKKYIRERFEDRVIVQFGNEIDTYKRKIAKVLVYVERDFMDGQTRYYSKTFSRPNSPKPTLSPSFAETVKSISTRLNINLEANLIRRNRCNCAQN